MKAKKSKLFEQNKFTFYNQVRDIPVSLSEGDSGEGVTLKSKKINGKWTKDRPLFLFECHDREIVVCAHTPDACPNNITIEKGENFEKEKSFN
ncbi:hypothetical protein [Enterococcus avium]|uniref:hypothetical protein n=3 Tax=Enterococcus TaxID=1350 RepID=UPI0032E38F82